MLGQGSGDPACAPVPTGASKAADVGEGEQGFQNLRAATICQLEWVECPLLTANMAVLLSTHGDINVPSTHLLYPCRLPV